MQLPRQEPWEPALHDIVHGVAAFVQSSVHVEPPSHVRSQPPPAQPISQVDMPSQSNVQPPPEHVYPQAPITSQSIPQPPPAQSPSQTPPRHSA
jgi:hypothetical protein